MVFRSNFHSTNYLVLNSIINTIKLLQKRATTVPKMIQNCIQISFLVVLNLQSFSTHRKSFVGLTKIQQLYSISLDLNWADRCKYLTNWAVLKSLYSASFLASLLMSTQPFLPDLTYYILVDSKINNSTWYLIIRPSF